MVRREAAAEQVRRWGGDRVVIDDDKLESNLAQSLSDTELDIVVDPVGGRAARQLVHHLRFGGTLVSHAVLSGQSASAAVLDLIGRHVNWTGFWLIANQLATPHRHRVGAQRLSRSGGLGRRRHAQRTRRPHHAAGGLEGRLDSHPMARRTGLRRSTTSIAVMSGDSAPSLPQTTVRAAMTAGIEIGVSLA